MSDKKNIDRLFQEKFKDFDPVPDEQLWKQIESSLIADGKKSKKIIPVWWRLGGIAAAIALLFTLGYNYTSIFNDTEQALPTEEIITTVEDVNDAINNKKEEVITNSEDVSNTKKSEEKAIKNTLEVTKTDHNKEAVTNEIFEKEDNHPYKKLPATKKNPLINSVGNKSLTATSYAVKDKKSSTTTSAISSKSENNKKETVAYSDIPKEKEINLNIDNKAVEKELKSEKDAAITTVETPEKEKPSLLDAIEEQNALKQEAIVEKSNKKWVINPTLAPVYYSSLSNGSPIHSQFVDNSKSGNVNLSYGVNIAYELTNRLSIRSGVNKVNYGYNTDNVALTSTGNELQAIENITFSNISDNIAINDKQTSAPQNQSFDAVSRAITPEIDAVLTQELGYIEIPLELKYRLVDKKLGVNIIGGISSLFLTNNDIIVESEDFTTEVGEANNINSTNFSTNIGIGVDYQISEKVIINLEPVFKYQLNTFSGDDGGFKPYALGVYTGLSFRF